MDKPRLLTEAEIAEIREGVRFGLRGPILLKWLEWLLADREERIRLELARPAKESRRRP